MEMLTVNELLKLCQEQIASGNGDKKIMLPCDAEGNDFRGLYFHFVEAEKIFADADGEVDYDNIPREMRNRPMSEFIVLG